MDKIFLLAVAVLPVCHVSGESLQQSFTRHQRILDFSPIYAHRAHEIATGV